MSIMVWSEKLSVGVERFDNEHKKLVEMLNGLHDEMLKGKAANVIGPLLSNLVKYTQTHFANEEALFKTHHYPNALTHKLEHDQLRKKAAEMDHAFKEGRINLSTDTMKFLKDWLTKHILGTDMQYKDFLNAKGVK
jgi:hemerythrin-like metal-binding protein